MADQSDLFGQAPAQGSLFGDGEDRMSHAPQSSLPDPDLIRRRLLAIIEKIRSSERMPWSEKDARMWQTVFPNMTRWLPDEEGAQLRFEFTREMTRLSQAA